MGKMAPVEIGALGLCLTKEQRETFYSLHGANQINQHENWLSENLGMCDRNNAYDYTTSREAQDALKKYVHWR